jgi:hypothetical protein
LLEMSALTVNMCGLDDFYVNCLLFEKLSHLGDLSF